MGGWQGGGGGLVTKQSHMRILCAYFALVQNDVGCIRDTGCIRGALKFEISSLVVDSQITFRFFRLMLMYRLHGA